MAIYGRFGQRVIILRPGTLDDVRLLDCRRPDDADREAVANGSYVVVMDRHGAGRLYHKAYIRADDGSLEITRAADAAAAAPIASPAPSYTCECPAPERRLYVVTDHDGRRAVCSYCDDCAAEARAGSNGETASIEGCEATS